MGGRGGTDGKFGNNECGAVTMTTKWYLVTLNFTPKWLQDQPQRK